MQDAGSVFDGVAFHCYAGDVSDQSEFTAKYPSKEVFFTECTGTIGTDWWSDIKVSHISIPFGLTRTDKLIPTLFVM